MNLPKSSPANSPGIPQARCSPPQLASDASAAWQRLEAFRETTGRKLSLLAAVSEFCESAAKLRGHSLSAAADTFLRVAATVKRQDLSAGVEEFLASREPLTKLQKGQTRPQLDPAYHGNVAAVLRKLSGAFPATAVCDLCPEHVEKFLASLSDLAPKTRNHHRQARKLFFGWCSRRDYLSREHRLNEADAMNPEHANTAEIGILTPPEFRKLLLACAGPLQVVIAIGGLAGLRVAEILRLDWQDVWRLKDHIEITAQKSKTRARRLVPICGALKAWLRPYSGMTSGAVWPKAWHVLQRDLTTAFDLAGVKRADNVLRHSFITYRLAATANENQVAQESGNTPSMIYGHYRALTTPKAAEQWFAVKPTKGSAADKMLIVPGIAAGGAA